MDHRSRAARHLFHLLLPMPAAFKSHPHVPFPPSVPVTPVREKVQIHKSTHLQNGKKLLYSCNKAQQLTQSPPGPPRPALIDCTLNTPPCNYLSTSMYIYIFLFTQGYLFIYLLIVIYYYLAVAVNVHSNLSFLAVCCCLYCLVVFVTMTNKVL